MAKKILVVDDEENIRLLYKVEFTEMGYEVVSAANGLEALEILKKDNNISLIILDIKMEKMNGIEAIKNIMDMRKDFKVVISSAYNEFKDDFNTWAADAYIIKSADTTELKETVKKLLEK